MQEIVEDQRTGLHFNPGDIEDLTTKVNWILDRPENWREWGRQRVGNTKADIPPKRTTTCL